MGQLPCHSVRSHDCFVDLDAARAAHRKVDRGCFPVSGLCDPPYPVYPCHMNWTIVVRPSGFEPETCGLRVRCSAVELEARPRV